MSVRPRPAESLGLYRLELICRPDPQICHLQMHLAGPNLPGLVALLIFQGQQVLLGSLDLLDLQDLLDPPVRLGPMGQRGTLYLMGQRGPWYSKYLTRR